MTTDPSPTSGPPTTIQQHAAGLSDPGSNQANTLLITLSGPDKPGVTALVFASLSGYGVAVLDIEQIVLRGQLILGVLISAPRQPRVIEQRLEDLAGSMGMEVIVTDGLGDNLARRAGRSHVTLIGSPLRPGDIAAVAGRIADIGGNIDRIERMARYPVVALELHVSGADTERLSVALAEQAVERDIDLAVQPANLLRHGRRLVVMDVDSTLIQGEVIEMLAARAGCEQEVASITARAMAGDLDFESSLRERVALLEGLEHTVLGEVAAELVLTPGARTLVRTLKRLGYEFALVSGGFTEIIKPLADLLDITLYRANTLEVKDGRLTGKLDGPVIDRAEKAAALREFADSVGITLKATVAIGDGANDLDMLAAAGLGVAFNAKPVVQQAADTTLNVPFLDAILYLLGISREEVEAADADAGYTTPAPAV